MLWETIVDSFTRKPRDVITIPTKGDGVWFYVSSKSGRVFVSGALTHTPPSQVRGSRQLDRNNCDTMFALYQRRKAGEPVSQEASSITQNQVYWYGIFNDLNL